MQLRKLHAPPGIIQRLVLIGVIAASLAGCGGKHFGMPDLPAALIQVPEKTSVPFETEAPQETQAPGSTDQTRRQEEPLRFTLPTPGPQPISLWRPPLYDTPWALGPFDHFYFNRPIAADEVNWPVADYRYGGDFFGSDIVHTGIDIPSPTGTPVLAAANGLVVWAGYGLFSGESDPDDPYGLAVTIRHNFGYEGKRLYTVYAHMDEILVNVGQEIKSGDMLGMVGTTGFTTGPHLHFEVRMEQNSYFATFNPELWLAPPQGWGVLAGTLMNTNGSLLNGQDVKVVNEHTGDSWTVRSYGNQAVNSDPYLQENLVLSDLPAGRYRIIIDYLEERYQTSVEITPGAVSYFKFRGKLYFDTSLPSVPSIEEITGADLANP
jgi:murein DD-endopeptidase MepM/ murein hydrolase activator NlpD